MDLITPCSGSGFSPTPVFVSVLRSDASDPELNSEVNRPASH